MKRIITVLVLTILTAFSLVGCSSNKEKFEEINSKIDALNEYNLNKEALEAEESEKIGSLYEYNLNKEALESEENEKINEYVRLCIENFYSRHYYRPHFIRSITVEKSIQHKSSSFNYEEENVEYIVNIYGVEYYDIYFCMNGETLCYKSIKITDFTL